MSYSLRKVFSREDKDWKTTVQANEDARLVTDQNESNESPSTDTNSTSSNKKIRDKDPLHLDNIPRVASRVSSTNADGSAETILESTTSAISSVLSPYPLAKSASKKTPSFTSDLGLSYVLNKVFSRESAEDWNEKEAEGLVSHSEGLSRVSSRIDAKRDGEAEMVLKGDDDSDGEEEDRKMPANLFGRRSNESSPILSKKEIRTMPSTDEQGEEDNDKMETVLVGKKGGYSLRKFFSMPRGSSKASASLLASDLKRTPSYEPSASSRLRQDEDLDDQDESPLFSDPKSWKKLKSPVKLIRSPGSPLQGKNKSLTKQVGSKEKLNKKSIKPTVSDDASTVAESIDSSQNADFFRKESSFGGKRPKYWKKLAIGIAFVGLSAIGAAVFLATHKSKGGVPNSALQISGSSSYPLIAGDTESPTTSPSSNPTQSPHNPTAHPSDAPTTSPTKSPTKTPTTTPTDSPSKPPTASPSHSPTYEPTFSPTEDSTITFYIMADTPYDDEQRTKLMPRHINELNEMMERGGKHYGDDAVFLVHLGDLQFQKVDQCKEYAYESASDILKESEMPVFVLPGDNDINDCDNYDNGVYYWRKYFRKLDQRWSYPFSITRWGQDDESFSFLYNGVLFFGLNIIGGTPASRSEWADRHEEHLEEMIPIMKKRWDEYEVVVLFAHAEPSGHHDDFFKGSKGLINFVEDMGKPFVHFHGDWHEYYEVDGAFDVDNYLRISLDGESVARPIRVDIDSRRKNPVRISRRESGLYVECCRRGWPHYGDDDYSYDDDDYDD